jgi:hypothetical protein
MAKTTIIPGNYKDIRAGIVELLKSARSVAARNVNSIMTAAYWEIGRRIVKFEQGGESRAEYGEQLIQQLSGDLTRRFGRGFGRANLWQMRAFYSAWPEARILQTPSGESTLSSELKKTDSESSAILALAPRFSLPWSAYVRLLSVKNLDARAFYEKEAHRSGWSVRQLDRQIDSQFYERIALSKNKAAMLEKPQKSEPSDLTTAEEAIKDPFVLEFLDLKDEYSESILQQPGHR